MAGKTYNIMRHKDLLGLNNMTSAEMFSSNPEIGDIIFNTDIQSIAQYTVEGWQDLQKNFILTQFFYENWESGNFTQNNWQLANDSNNEWIVGQDEVYNKTYSSYISRNGVDAKYKNNKSQISHLYKNLTLPTSTKILLEFILKVVGETNYDYMQVYWLPSGTTPVAGTLPNSNYLISGNYENISDWTKQTIDLTQFSGQNGNLCFTWKNDSSVGNNPPSCLDNILISHQ